MAIGQPGARAHLLTQLYFKSNPKKGTP